MGLAIFSEVQAPQNMPATISPELMRSPKWTVGSYFHTQRGTKRKPIAAISTAFAIKKGSVESVTEPAGVIVITTETSVRQAEIEVIPRLWA